jgi:ribosomal protein S18 acetylase RimI-like enzyme
VATIEIRPVRPDEFVQAGRVTARAYEEFAPPEKPQWQAYLQRIADVAGRAGRAAVLVAIVEGAIAGTVSIELDHHIEPDWEDPVGPDRAHLRMLGVDPEFRRRGVGRALVEASIDFARAHARSRLTLETTEPMRAAQAMYESMGFTPAGREEWEPGLTFLRYELPLQPAAATS